MPTKKDFIATANIIKSMPKAQRKSAATKFAKMYKAQNPLFDDAKFFKACGV